MEKRYGYDASATTVASADTVWGLLADSRTWPDWGTFDRTEVEPPSVAGQEGVGTVRHLVTGRVDSVERLVTFEPGRQLSYELVRGLPLKDYRADVTLTPAVGGGTTVRWQARFNGKYPVTGKLIEVGLKKMARRLVDGLVRAAEATEAAARGGA